MIGPLLRVFGLFRGQAAWLIGGLLISVGALAAALGLMAYAGASVGATALVGTVVVLRSLGVARVVLRYFERLVTHAATFRALADLRIWFFRGLARSAGGGLGFRRAGDVLSRLVGDVEALDGLYLRIIVPLASLAILLPVLLWVIGRRDPALAVAIGLCLVLAAFVLPAVAAVMTRRAGDRLAAASGGLRVAALDALSGLREVRAYSAEGRMLAAVQAREATLLAAQRDVAGRTALAGAGAFLCAQAALLAVLVAAGSDPAGAIVAAFLVTATFEAAGGLPRAGALAGYASAAAERVLSAATEPPRVLEPTDPAPRPTSGSLNFEAVRFAWDADRPPVLDALTLAIPAGARVAVLGASGAGKSTLAALALRIATPESGRVLLGDTDIVKLRADDVHRQVTLLNQATHLFDDTIRNNLLLARPDADDAALWTALDGARIAEMVRALPDGLDTWVGEGGARLSGGQGRRLALARALLSPAPVLILDEPCAGLDADTERAFFETLNEAAAGRTVLLIAHRLTGAERLDRIWRLAGGRAIAAAA